VQRLEILGFHCAGEFLLCNLNVWKDPEKITNDNEQLSLCEVTLGYDKNKHPQDENI
jgi:hypothetical protein